MITIFMILAVYVLSIFTCRYTFRMQYIWGHWDKESCEVTSLWFIPIVNTVASIVFLISGYCGKKRTYKYKLPNWFTNKDL